MSYLEGLATPTSRRTMRQHLDALARDASGGELDALAFPWHELTFEHTARLRAAMLDRLGTATVNQRLAGLRQVLRRAWRLGLMTAEASARAADIERVRGSGALRGRSLGGDEIRRIFAACTGGPAPAHGARDAALLAVLFGCALRRTEATTLDVADWDRLAGCLRVNGKGRRARETPVSGAVADYLDAWLEHRGDSPGPLFRTVSRAGRVLQHRLGPSGVYRVLEKRARQGAVANVSPHDLRRTAATVLLDEGADLNTVRLVLGHSNLSTTTRYDHRDVRAVRGAVDLLKLPSLAGRASGA